MIKPIANYELQGAQFLFFLRMFEENSSSTRKIYPKFQSGYLSN